MNDDQKTVSKKAIRRRVSSVDVAREAGVSQALVSYVFNGRNGATVPASTRERILETAKTLGYRPNRSAQSLKTGCTQVIAFWNADIDSALSSQVLHWVRQAVEADGYEIMISANFTSKTMARWPVDGILAFDSLWHILALLRMEKPDAPLVSLGAFHVEDHDHVGIDLYSGTRAAMQHLIAGRSSDHAPSRIAYFVEAGSNAPTEARHMAYVDAMREAGLPLEYMTLSGFVRESARVEIVRYVNEHGAPDSIFCMNDEIAIGAQRGLRDIGLRIPEDVAIMGCDGINETAYHFPAISTIVQPLEEVCTLGWKFLKNRIRHPELPLQREVLTPTLAIRESTRR